jgi:hypothetical protein
MNKISCDRCGKDWNSKFLKMIIQSNPNPLKKTIYSSETLEKFDLCEECYLKFIQELKEDKK